jgi:hypothetical protein
MRTVGLTVSRFIRFSIEAHAVRHALAGVSLDLVADLHVSETAFDPGVSLFGGGVVQKPCEQQVPCEKRAALFDGAAWEKS